MSKRVSKIGCVYEPAGSYTPPIFKIDFAFATLQMLFFKLACLPKQDDLSKPLWAYKKKANTSLHVRHAMFASTGDGTARDVFSVVRDSRMWCPHDIGRDSWVWEEQETL